MENTINAADYGTYHLEFFAMFVLAGIGTRLPFVRLPLRWLETFFHEMSHGLAALLTFGRPLKLELKWNGAGMMTSRGGWSIPILLAGYIGASLWGLVIYLAGYYMAQGSAVLLTATLFVFIVVCTLLFVRDVVTLFIMGLLAGFFFIPLQFTHLEFFPDLLRFIGLGVGFNALKAPLDLIDGKLEGDGADLQRKTLIPEGVWILLWFFIGILSIVYMWQIPLPASERLFDFLPFIQKL